MLESFKTCIALIIFMLCLLTLYKGQKNMQQCTMQIIQSVVPKTEGIGTLIAAEGHFSDDDEINDSDSTDDENFYIHNHPISADNHNKMIVPVEPLDLIYTANDWDSAPIVLESHKLIFFTIPKVGCTVWKFLFRRMMGYHDWNVEDHEKLIPHNPVYNGLQYLYHYNRSYATHIMNSPEWTRAIFVREPKERVLSAYFDKAVRQNGKYVISECCYSAVQKNQICSEQSKSKTWVEGKKSSSQQLNFDGEINAKQYNIEFEDFLNLIEICNNNHWNPQSQRLDAKFFPLINFVGHLDSAQEDAKQLLMRVGAWEKYGRSGWGLSGTNAIFQKSTQKKKQHYVIEKTSGSEHSTNAVQHMKQYYTPKVEKQVDEFYKYDYQNRWLNIERIRIYN